MDLIELSRKIIEHLSEYALFLVGVNQPVDEFFLREIGQR